MDWKLWILPVALLALPLSGCGGKDRAGEPEPPPPKSCESDTMAEPFTAGMSRTTEGGVHVAVMAGDPAPPIQGRNTWTLALEDAAGAPLAGADVKVTCVMFHAGGGSHSCPADVGVEDLGGGNYEAYPIVFNMDGHWDVDVVVTAGDAAEIVTFSICIE